MSNTRDEDLDLHVRLLVVDVDGIQQIFNIDEGMVVVAQQALSDITFAAERGWNIRLVSEISPPPKEE